MNNLKKKIVQNIKIVMNTCIKVTKTILNKTFILFYCYYKNFILFKMNVVKCQKTYCVYKLVNLCKAIEIDPKW